MSQAWKMGPQNGKTGKGDCADVKTVPPLPGVGGGWTRTCSESAGGLEAEPGRSQILEPPAPPLARPPLSPHHPNHRNWFHSPLTCPTMPFFPPPPPPGSLLSDLKAAPGFGRRHPPQQEGEMSFSKPSQLRNIGAL